MKLPRLVSLLSCLVALSAAPALWGQATHDFVEQFDSAYNTITIARKGSVVEMRAKLNERGREYVESAVNLDDPLRLVVPYTKTLFAGLFVQPDPKRVLMIGLGGGGFHRLFVFAHPESLLHTVELDAKVQELAERYMGFRAFDRMPVTIQDGRMFVKRNQEQWDWIILDAFRGGFVPPHLKTQEFYRECAARLNDRGVLISNLHDGTKLFAADLKTLSSVFPQVVLFSTGARGNVIACAVNYREPDITNPANWADVDAVNARFAGRLPMNLIRGEHMIWPTVLVESARVQTDDFNESEMLNVIETNNQGTGEEPEKSSNLPRLLLYGAGAVVFGFVLAMVVRAVRRK